MSLKRFIFFKRVQAQQGEQQPNIVTNGLMLYLDAGNPASYPGTGTTWTDLSGNGNNGTLQNGVGFSSLNSGSLTFDGVNDWVSTNYNGVTGQTARTVSVWFYPNILQSRNLLGWGTQSNFQMWDILPFGANVGVHIYNSGSEAGTAYSAATWQQITFTYTHPTIRSYMNAVYKNQYTNNGINTGSNEKFNIGRGIYTNYAHFNGRIAQVLVYNRELSQQEIQQNFDAVKGRFGL